MRRLAVLLLAGLTAAGCSSAPPAAAPSGSTSVYSAAARPAWTSRIPAAERGNLFFVGLASGVDNLEEGRKRSRQDAYGQIAEYLGQEIRIDYRIERSVTQTGADPALTLTVVKDVQQAIAEQVAARAKVTEIHEERGRVSGREVLNVWSLVTFPEDQSGSVVAEAVNSTAAGYRASHREDASRILGQVREALLSGQP